MLWSHARLTGISKTPSDTSGNDLPQFVTSNIHTTLIRRT